MTFLKLGGLIILFFCAFSEQEVHTEARNLLSITLNGLTSFKCMDQYDPSSLEAQPHSADGVLQFDAWLTPRFGDLDAAVRPPHWYVPSEAEVSALQQLKRPLTTDQSFFKTCE